mmetsp:Transcript_23024/g.74206  ORF Transcript_23024/g.74206 Transcript_23024/m.74206 type:complete len:209 (+) Transcript_23024:607-1233(+)
MRPHMPAVAGGRLGSANADGQRLTAYADACGDQHQGTDGARPARRAGRAARPRQRRVRRVVRLRGARPIRFAAHLRDVHQGLHLLEGAHAHLHRRGRIRSQVAAPRPVWPRRRAFGRGEGGRARRRVLSKRRQDPVDGLCRALPCAVRGVGGGDPQELRRRRCVLHGRVLAPRPHCPHQGGQGPGQLLRRGPRTPVVDDRRHPRHHFP